jgi:NDP-sugar pyrophosphorylase family protein
MNIVIPMAGHSRRFKTAGYHRPKAFIDVNGLPMIHWVCQMFSPKDHFFFVTLKEHVSSPEYRKILENAAQNVKVIEVDPHEKGPVYSTLLADSELPDDEPVIICYCDFYQHWRYRQFKEKMVGYRGGMAVFKGYHPASFGETYYAYLKTNDKNEMLELREKQSFTDNRHEEFASTGVYYIESWKLYRKYANLILNNDIKVGNEYYASLIYNPMVADGITVGLFEVEKFICWGTPEDLEQFLFWSSFFIHDIPEIKKRIIHD